MADNKIKYELSVWQDVTPSGGVNEPFFEERKLAVIGGDDIHTPISAYNVTEKQQISGANTLTFNMVRKYWHNGELVDNPFIGLLNTEVKVKLRIGEPYQLITAQGTYDADAAASEDTEEKWQDYILKKVDVDRNTYINIYTCEAAFTAELGRNGWSTTLNTELENNYGSLYDLTKEVLKNTDIEIAGYVYPTEKLAEQLFSYQVQAGDNLIVEKTIIDGPDTALTIPVGDIVYFFYSGVETNNNEESEENSYWSIKDGENRILYRPTPFSIEDCDDNYVVIDYNDEYQYDVKERNNHIAGHRVYPVGSPLDPAQTGYSLQGKKIIKSYSSHFEPVADKYVSDYTCMNPQGAGADNDLQGTTVFSYNETQYFTTGVINNYVTNHNNFINLIGWRPENINLIRTFPKSIPNFDPSTGEPINWEAPVNYLNFTKGGYYYNLGLKDLQFIKDEIYIIRVRARRIKSDYDTYDDTNYTTVISNQTSGDSITNLKINIGQVTEGTNSTTVLPFLTASAGVPLRFIMNNGSTISDYGFPAAAEARTPLGDNLNTFINDEFGYCYAFVKISMNTTVDQKPSLIISLDHDMATPWDVQDIQFFKYVEDEHGLPVFPEDIPTGYSKIIQHFYYIGANKEIKELSNNLDYYVRQYMPNYAAVRHLEVSESNYFNIINSLSELFEVWVRFKLYHTKDGHIMFNENGYPKREIFYSQYAPFEEYNWSGFKYKQNLSNIKKNTDSSEITTKMIVQNNVNEFAKDGICSITRAIDNPSGENILYNFDYYINMGLLDKDQVMTDLYGIEEENLGYYPKMKAINDELVPLNERINSVLGALAQAKEMYNYSNISYDSALEEYRNALKKYHDYENISTAAEKNTLWSAVCEAKSKMEQFDTDREMYERQMLEYEKLLYGKIADLENRPYYKGNFNNQTAYSEGDLVSWKDKLYFLVGKPKYLTWFNEFGFVPSDPSRPPGPNPRPIH